MDLRSILVSGSVLSIVNILLSLHTLRISRGRQKGPGYWLAGFMLMTASMALLALYERLPQLVSVFMGCGLLLAGIMLKSLGFARFLGITDKGITWLLAGALAVSMALVLAFLYVRPDLVLRIVVVSAAACLFSLTTVYILGVKAPRELRREARLAGSIFAALAVIFLFRIHNVLHWSFGNDWLYCGNLMEVTIVSVSMALYGAIAVSEMQLMYAYTNHGLREASIGAERANESLVEEVRRRALAEDELRLANMELGLAQKEIMITLSELIESRSRETANHVARVGEYSRLLCRACGMDEDEAALIADAAPMHDIGKISVSDAILNKEGPLTDGERDLMRTHTVVGHRLLAGSSRPLLRMAAVISLEHHEYWDGTGYPEGKAGARISLAGRVVCICDVFDALLSKRHYKDPWELPRVVGFLREKSGSMFDPGLVDVFLCEVDGFSSIASTLRD